MNTLIFIAGMGAGSLLSAILLLSTIRLIVGKSTLNTNDESLALMKERNATEAEVVTELRGIKDIIKDYLA